MNTASSQSGQSASVQLLPATAQTEALDKTPPHGMKGALPPVPGLVPGSILNAATTLLAVALIVSLFMWTIAWWRARARRKVNSLEHVFNPSLWAELRQAIAKIAVPVGSENDEPSQADWNHFSSEVSLCLRRGLELRTGYPLAESTTEEIMALLAKGSLRLVVVSDSELRDTLTRLDSIRFGGGKMTRDEAGDILIALKRWCDQLEADEREGLPTSHSKPLGVDEKGGLRVFNS